VNLALWSDLPARTSRSFKEAKAKVKEAKEGRTARLAHDRRIAGDGCYPFWRSQAIHNRVIYLDQIFKVRRALCWNLIDVSTIISS
jgi:hypothetical protein